MYEDASADISNHDVIEKMVAHKVFYRVMLKRMRNQVEYKMQIYMSEVVK